MKVSRVVAGAAAALALLGVSAVAATDTSPPAPPPPASTHALTPDDVGAWLDGFVPYAIARAGVAGAEVVVVKDGQVIFERGYGVSDEQTQAPVDPKTTLFRPGSISKLFTWTSVMQLVDEGKLDLDTDINTYLDFKIPSDGGRPITLRDLMTHRPGFEETVKNLFTTDPKELPPLRTALVRWVPTRVFPAGEVPAYSNYGAGLAGYIVQRISGEPFPEYVKRHIFDPLGMQHATFEQPLPKSMQADMSKGYMTASDEPRPFELVLGTPAGGLSASGDDLSLFMRAHLNNGEFNGVRILSEKSAKAMHGIVYPVPPGTLPMGLGFYHSDRNGHVVVGHGGDTIVFHSDMFLVLDQNVGLYVTQNSAGKPLTDMRTPLFYAFMDRYFPAPLSAAEPPTLKTERQDGAGVTGYFGVSRSSFSNMLRISRLINQIHVSQNSDGTLSADEVVTPAGTPKKFREIAPDRWREVHGRSEVIFTRKNGRVDRLYENGLPPILTITPEPWWESAGWNLPLVIAALLMLALTVLFWPIKSILRWRYERPFALSGRPATLYRLTRVVALLDLVFIGCLAGLLMYGSEHLEVLSRKYDNVFRVIQLVGVIGVIGTIVPIFNVAYGWHDGARPWWTRCTDVLIALSCIAVVWLVFQFNLITSSMNY